MNYFKKLFSSEFVEKKNHIYSKNNFELIIDRHNITYIEGDKYFIMDCDWGPKNRIILFFNKEMIFWEAPYVEQEICDEYKDKILNNICQALKFAKLEISFHTYTIE